jgi:uncharacterized protein YggU (UPF0235/DUF167 family)
LDVVGGDGVNVGDEGEAGQGQRRADVIHLADLSIMLREKFSRNDFAIGRPGRSLKIKKPPDSGKAANEGIQRILMKMVHQAGLILLIDGEATPKQFGIRRAQPNRYPDLGFKPHSRLPVSAPRTSGIGNL